MKLKYLSLIALLAGALFMFERATSVSAKAPRPTVAQPTHQTTPPSASAVATLDRYLILKRKLLRSPTERREIATLLKSEALAEHALSVLTGQSAKRLMAIEYMCDTLAEKPSSASVWRNVERFLSDTNPKLASDQIEIIERVLKSDPARASVLRARGRSEIFNYAYNLHAQRELKN